MLFHYLDSHKSEEDLHVIYMLSGWMSKAGVRSRALKLVYGPDLECMCPAAHCHVVSLHLLAAKKSFTEISTEHVYSLQRYQPKVPMLFLD